MKGFAIPVVFLVVSCVLIVLPSSWAHNMLISPVPRTGAGNAANGCLVNGIIMGTSSAIGSSGETVQNNNRNMLGVTHPYYQKRPCGKSGQATMSKSVELCSSPENAYDVSKAAPSGISIPTYTAGSEITISIKGYMHPGVLMLRLCYGDCMNMDSYEKYILGYWFMEGTGGPSSDIYKPVVTAKVKLPNKNCNNCILQLISDVQDIRSYVSCADIKITGATSNAVDQVECNGHPYCNCNPSSGTGFGLGKRCPVGIASSGTNHGVLAGMTKADFCGFCISNGCPSTCGGIWQGTYNGANRIGGTHTSALPKYTTCSATTPCTCPGCRTKASFDSPPASTAAWSTGAWSACSATCGSGTQTRTVQCKQGTTTVGDNNCSGAKPVSVQTCTVEASCSAMWLVSDFGACNTQTKTQTRTVYCFDNGMLIGGSACTTTKPTSTQACGSGCTTSIRADGSVSYEPTDDGSGSSSTSWNSNPDVVKAAIGASIGGAALVLIIVFLVWGIVRARQRKQLDRTRQAAAAEGTVNPSGVNVEVR